MKTFRAVSSIIGLAFCFFYLGCGNPQLVPSISQVLPQTIIAGSGGATVKVTGANFSNDTVVLWNGTQLSTSTINSNTLSASVQGGSLTVPGTVHVQVHDILTGQQSQVVSIVIASPVPSTTPTALAISTTSLASGVAGTSYSMGLTATGGTGGYTWSITSGQLPSGMSLAASSGIISGTPTAIGDFILRITVVDSGSPQQSATATMTLSVAAQRAASLVINSAILPGATATQSYSGSLSATGGTGPYTWSVTSGQLPSGLSISATSGAISGTPTTSNTYNFGITVTDSGSPAQAASTSTSIEVAPQPLAIASSALSVGTDGTTYSQALQATGGTPGYTWSITSGSLPAGLSLNPTAGTISGTPVTSGTSNFMAKVSDNGHPEQSQSAALTLVVAPNQLAITSSTLPSGTSGTAYSQTLQASGGTPGYTWSITSGSLPAGLSMASSGVISGTPTASGTVNFTVTVSDKGSPVQTKSVALTLAIASNSLAIISSTLPSGTSGTTYSQTLQASGGTPGYTWSITSGSLPAGLSMASSGVISGTPTATGTSNFTATVSDNGNPVQTKSVALAIAISPNSLAIISSTLPSGTSGTTYSQTLQASGGTPGYTWSITSGGLPAGLSMASSGVISGTPTASGTANFTVTVSDIGSPVQTKSVALTLAIAPNSLAIISSTLSSGTSGTAYSQALQASGGTPGYTWSITSGSLPAGLSQAATTGTISGTPTASGTFNFTVTVNDNGNPVQTQSAAMTITVAAPTPTGPGTTWYIRPDGGSRYSANVTNGQCDGQADVAYSGSGTNQHCAFKDLRYMWDDQSYGNNAWVMAGGDTLIIRGCAGAASPACRVGWDAWTGAGAGYTWCYGGNGYQACHNPTIPAGTVSQPTRILGQNYANCGTSSTTNRSLLTQIFGGIGVGAAFNLAGAVNVQVECLEITRHSQCIIGGSPAFPGSCTAGVDDFDDEGITTDANTTNTLLQDLWIHGHPDTGIRGAFNGNMTCLRCNISYNGQSGWDFDDGAATPTGNTAAFTFAYSQIEWNGCAQEYPMTHTYPAISCYDQNSQGYGDGIGTPPGECFNVTIDHSLFDYNTQDGIDFGHFNTVNRTDGKCIVSITNSLSYANMGGQWKWGPAPTSVTFTNNLGIANCNRMSAGLTGAPSTYNANLSLFCRANDGYSFDFYDYSTLFMANNTFVTYAPTTFDVQCNDDAHGCTHGSWTFENNIVLGYANTPYSNYSGNYVPGGICGAGCNGSTSALPPMIRSNNLFYGVRGLTCPSGYTAEICLDPQFVNEPMGVGSNFVESELDNFNFNLNSASPAIGAGMNLSTVPSDYTGAQRANPPSIGAYEQ